MGKRHLLAFFVLVCVCEHSFSQLLCINCYDQNDSISQHVTNLLMNGGFENTTCGPNSLSNSFCPSSSHYNCDISNWTCTGGGIATYAHIYDTATVYSLIPQGLKAVYFGNYYCYCCSGNLNDTFCLAQNFCTTNAPNSGYPLSYPNLGDTFGVSLQQTIPTLSVGETYVLEFWTGGENINFEEDGLFAVDIGFGKIFLRDPATPKTTGLGRTYVIQFTATSRFLTVKFTNWGHVCNTCTELVLDNVRLYPLADLDPSVPHCATGNDEIKAAHTTAIFPGPFTNTLTISTGRVEPSEFVLYDMVSRPVLLRNFTGSVDLNTEHLPKGIYFFTLTDNTGVSEKGKVLKQ